MLLKDIPTEVYSLKPKEIKPIETKYRKIKTKLPVPESIPILKELRKVEPISMRGQPPIIWDHAEDFIVYDKWGNQWIDFSSGVLVTNAGHSHPKIVNSIIKQTQNHLLHNYCFPSEIRLECCKKILEVAPPYLDKIFMLTTGSEATECALKLARTYGHTKKGKEKNIVISFDNAFHGRTLGAQLMGGIPSLKEWIVNRDPDIIQVPFPDGFYNENISFQSFLDTLNEKNINPDNVCAVITESYQGGGADFLPKEYVKGLRDWCNKHEILLIFDEVQAGFGRTGKWFAFQHYDVEVDLVCLGKGLSSSLPASGVLGRQEILDLYPPGSMTSTHTGNPIVCAAVIANIDVLKEEKLIENARELGEIMHKKLQKLVDKYDIVGVAHGKGLVAGIQIVKPGTKIPDKELAIQICERIFENGVMLFSPVGKATLKLSPPLSITKEALIEALEVIEQAIDAFSR